MPDRDLQKFGAPVGTGKRSGTKHAYSQAIDEGRGHITGMRDIPNEALQIGARAAEGRRFVEKNSEYDYPISIAVARAQIPDFGAFPFDNQALNQAVAANAVGFAALTINIQQGIRAKLERFGWYTNAGGAANLSFGLYVGEELMLPGGKYVGDQPRPTTQYNPSGGSIDFEDLSMAPIPINPSTSITIRVTNADAVNAWPVWCRLYGWHWQDEPREDGRRAYFNQELKQII